MIPRSGYHQAWAWARARMTIKTDTMHWERAERGERGAADAALVLLYAPDFERLPAAVPIPEDGLIVGRAPPTASGLKVEHGAVSQLHARIRRAGDGWELKDLGSRNGTILNGRLVKGEAPLAPLDVLRFGDAIFKLVADDGAAYARYRIDGAGPNPDAVLVGGRQVRAVLEQLAAVATTPLSIVVAGETGTGKELVARAVHRLSGRPGPIVALNCAAIPPNLVESELFGYKRGAFTGAVRDKPGLVRAADRGTLFLDEIGDMPLDAQAKLLRLIETREVLPVGATAGEPVDVRFVCASHADLPAFVASGRFRGDLLARLNGASVRLPPLRERKEDLFALVRHFLRAVGAPDTTLRTSFMAGVLHWDWPYNVREVEAAVQRAVAVARGEPLSVDHLPDGPREAMREYGRPFVPGAAPTTASRPPPLPAAARRERPTDDELRALLAEHKGNVAAIARALTCDRAQVHRWMRYAGIDPNTFRD